MGRIVFKRAEIKGRLLKNKGRSVVALAMRLKSHKDTCYRIHIHT